MIQLAYVSNASRLMSSASLSMLLRQARASNKRHDITGMLLYKDGSFLQVLEGPAEGFLWLIGEGELAPRFLLSDPFVFFEEYCVDLSQDQAERVKAEATSTVAVLAITTPSSDGPWTANLQGPLVINLSESLGAQIVLPGQQPGVRQPFEPNLSAA